MDNHQLMSIIRQETCLKRRIIGVYPRDRLPKLVKNPRVPFGLIVNTDTSKGPGEHWVAIWVDSEGHAVFFDSFGEPPLFYGLEIDKFLTRNFGRFELNTIQVQHPKSS